MQQSISFEINNLSNMRENYTSATSRITDADIASESSVLLREEIRQQAATAVMAQANQTPKIALLLLR